MPQPKLYIKKLVKPLHGGLNYVEFDNHVPYPSEIIDFSVCINPYRLPARVEAELRRAPIYQYPDPDAKAFIRCLAEKTGLREENLVAGSGSTELIRATAMAYLGEKDTAVTLQPTYSEYELACHLNRAKLRKFKLHASDNFNFDVDAFIRYSSRFKPSAIFLCNPNNPTGGYIDREQFELILKHFSDVLVILDEAYLAFTQESWNSLQLLKYKNLLIIRSLTKDFGIAGLRLGYAAASEKIIAALKKVLPPWNVNSVAQHAGVIISKSDGHLKKQAEQIQAGKSFLEQRLANMGFKVVPSRTNFFLVRVGNAALFKDRLLRKGFLVRDSTSFGLPAYVRIAARSMRDCRKLTAAIRAIQREGAI